MNDLLIAIHDKVLNSSGIKYQSDLDGTNIKRSDGKQLEITPGKLYRLANEINKHKYV